MEYKSFLYTGGRFERCFLYRGSVPQVISHGYKLDIGALVNWIVITVAYIGTPFADVLLWFRTPVRHSEGPPFRKVRHSESRHSWSLHGIVLDIATTRRLTRTLTLTLTVSLTVSCHCCKWLKMADPSEWRPVGMAAPRNGGPTPLLSTKATAVLVLRRTAVPLRWTVTTWLLLTRISLTNTDA